MAVTKAEIRRGTYYDSIVLMELQAALAALPCIDGVGVMMGTTANKDLLDQKALLTSNAANANTDDLIISIGGDNETAVEAAFREVDALLIRRRTTIDQEYLPKRLETAAKMLPEAQWVLISVPGRYATGVAREALHLQKNVFLYSDNVRIDDEVALKDEACAQGLLVMGPDCGTALLGGVGLGFSNRVRRGPIGLVGASGTGLQHVTTHIHRLGSGITHALGTGGRDLTDAVDGKTAQQALDVLRRDPKTNVIVLLSKPPGPRVAAKLLQCAASTHKHVVLYFTGYVPPGVANFPNIHLASSLDETAELAVSLAASERQPEKMTTSVTAPPPQYLRGLFSGGTLAYEALRLLHAYLPVVYSNTPLHPDHALENPLVSQGHTILDLGADLFTVGRLHPMLDNTLRLERLAQEAANPHVGMLLLDVVLGDGAHPDPVALLGPAIAHARAQAEKTGRTLDVIALIVGTDEDPQDMALQISRLQAVGAHVETRCGDAIDYVGQRLRAAALPTPAYPPVSLEALESPFQALNVGLESFVTSLTTQDVPVIHVDWHPPAGGNEKLLSILERMKRG